jgi:hypothetical protein
VPSIIQPAIAAVSQASAAARGRPLKNIVVLTCPFFLFATAEADAFPCVVHPDYARSEW